MIEFLVFWSGCLLQMHIADDQYGHGPNYAKWNAILVKAENKCIRDRYILLEWQRFDQVG